MSSVGVNAVGVVNAPEGHVRERHGGAATSVSRWRDIDLRLRDVAKRRGVLDREEAQLLCMANRIKIWKAFGKVSLLAYMEEVLGYGPKAARDRVRVALALEVLPELADALATGEQSYSALRELTRIVTPDTELAWRETVKGMNLRQIEELVAVHKPGDLPSDPPSPELRKRTVSFELSPATFALLRQVQQILANERGGMLDDDALMATLCSAVIDGSPNVANDEVSGRAKYQIMTTVCEWCRQGWQQAGGVNIAIERTDVERAECDAQRIGSDREPARATQDVSPMVRRFVTRRDHGGCVVPGCRSARFGEIHHIVGRAEGGGHGADNLAVLCGAHHIALHEGHLKIRGSAPALTFEEALSPHVGPDLAILNVLAAQALHSLGFGKLESKLFVEAAIQEVPEDVSLEELIKAALRHSRAP